MDGPGCYRAAVFLAALRPDSPERQLALGDVAGEMGAREIAADVYTRVVESFPETPESETAAEKLRALEGETTVN
ncbi:MAG TPA: hypothetical protein VGR00_09545 [Thermoanaerobaculia bacterium]|nr:hypothetical protein [Thermoanaerobaculia bacterium]